MANLGNYALMPGPGDPVTWPHQPPAETYRERRVSGVAEIGVGLCPVQVVLQVYEDGQTDVEEIYPIGDGRVTNIAPFLTAETLEYCERIVRIQNNLRNTVLAGSWAEVQRAIALKDEYPMLCGDL